MHPQILIFSCNWDGWSCIESATTLGLSYPASVKIIRVNCLSRIHVGLILKAFDFGADGVMLLGCGSGNCHFCTDSEYINREFEKTRTLLEMLGISKDRLALVRLPAFDGTQFVAEINNLISEIEAIPASRRSKIIGSASVQDIMIT